MMGLYLLNCSSLNLISLVLLLLLTSQALQPPLLRMSQPWQTPFGLRVFVHGAATSFMVISHDKLMVVRIDRYIKNHRSFLNVLDNHVDIANLHNITGCSLSRINLHGLSFILLLLDAILLLRRMRLSRSLLRPV